MKKQCNKIELENGLTIFFYLDSTKHSTLVKLVTKFGGMDKDFKIDDSLVTIKDGTAHLLEHYLCEQSKLGNIIEQLGKMQMSANATTSISSTQFFFQGVEKIEEGLKLLLNGINQPNWSHQKLEEIKEPIYQEIRMHNDNKFEKLTKEKLDNLFQTLTFRTLGGTIQEVQSITLEEIQKCFKIFYQPQNQFIIVAGNFNEKKILNTIKECYEKKIFSNHIIEKIKKEEPRQVIKENSTIEVPTAQEWIDITYKVNVSHLSNRERLKLDFYIANYLRINFSTSSNLYKKLVKEEIITYGISYHHRWFENNLIISIGTYTDQKEKLIQELTKQIEKKDIDEELFELYQKQSIANIAIREENISSIIEPFIDNIITFDYPYFDTVEDMENMSLTEIKKFIQELDFSNKTIIILTPKKEDK